jgi:DinB superfamily
MDSHVTKAGLLDELRATRNEWEKLLAQTDEGPMTQPGTIGDWSAKDVIAHCNSYAQIHVNQLQAHLRGEQPPLDGTAYASDYLSVDERNRLDFLKNQHCHWDDVSAESRRVFQQLIESVKAQSEEFLIQPQTFAGLPEPVLIWKQLEHVCDHYRGHLQSIRSWLSNRENTQRS